MNHRLGWEGGIKVVFELSNDDITETVELHQPELAELSATTKISFNLDEFFVFTRMSKQTNKLYSNLKY